MNILVEHIQYLLRSHDCIVLPGIGALMAVHRAAHTDADTEALLPPRRTLCFNPAINSNDGLLATSIARREGISFEAAREKVDRQCGMLQQQLATEESVTLPGIGTLHQGPEGNISFMPDAEYASPLFFGLQPLTIPTLQYLQQQRELAQQQTAELASPDINTAETTDNTPKRDPRFFYFKVRKSIIRAAACVMLAIGIGATLWGVIPHDNLTDTASLIPVSSKVENVENTIQAPKVVVRKSESKPENKPQTTEEKAEDQGVSNVEIEPGTYYLIVASTKRQAVLDQFMQMHQDDPSLHIIERKGMKRVYCDKSQNRDDLTGALRDKDFLTRYPGAWIWQGK